VDVFYGIIVVTTTTIPLSSVFTTTYRPYSGLDDTACDANLRTYTRLS